MTCDSPQNSVETSDEAAYLVTGIEQPVILAMRGMSCKALRKRRDDGVGEKPWLACGPLALWFEAASAYVKESDNR